MDIKNFLNKEALKHFFKISIRALFVSLIFASVFTIFVYLNLLPRSYIAPFLFALILVSVVIISWNNKRRLYQLLLYGLLYLVIGIILLLSSILAAKVSAEPATLLAVTSIYFLISMVFILIAFLLELLANLTNILVVIVVLISAFLAYYYPTYTATLVQNIYGLEEALLISTTISLMGLPVFNKLRKATSNKLSSQLLMVVVVFLFSLLLMAFYLSFIQIQVKNNPILINSGPLGLFTRQAPPMQLDTSAIVYTFSIVSFILGVLGVFIVIRKLNLIFRDLSKGKHLSELEVTEEHFKEMEMCLSTLLANMKNQLAYVYFDPVLPLPKSDNLRAVLNKDIPWWDKAMLEKNIQSGVSNDILKDVSYHLDKDLNKTVVDFVDNLHKFAPRRLETYCHLYDALSKKYDQSLLQILYSNIIKSNYHVNYNLDIIKQEGLENKYKKAVKSLDQIREISNFKKTESELKNLINKVNEIENFLR